MKLLKQKFHIYTEIDKAFNNKVLSYEQVERLFSKFHLSERQFYRYLKQFEEMGAPIGYDYSLGGYTYTGKYRVEFLINTKPELEISPGIYSKLSDRTLVKMKTYNMIDSLIFHQEAGRMFQLAQQLQEKLKVRIPEAYRYIYGFKDLGAPIRTGENKELCYKQGHRFNFIINRVPLGK